MYPAPPPAGKVVARVRNRLDLQQLAFSSWLWPVIGFFVAPRTTMMWVLVAPGGVAGLDWLWIGLAVLLDISFWTGGVWGNRDRMPGSSQAA